MSKKTVVEISSRCHKSVNLMLVYNLFILYNKFDLKGGSPPNNKEEI